MCLKVVTLTSIRLQTLSLVLHCACERSASHSYREDTPAGLDLHIDLAYYESPHGLQLLHCRRFDAGVMGGNSTFIDGFVIAEELRRRAA